MSRQIEVRAGDSAEVIAVICEVDTIAKGKLRARYISSPSYQALAEMSEPFQFVGLFVNGTLEWEV